MLRRKKKEQTPDEWILQVFQDTCVDRAWDDGDVHVMLGKEAWMWLIFRNGKFESIPPAPEGYPSWEEAVTAGLAGIRERRDVS